MRVLMIGVDQTSRGGIASVVRAYANVYQNAPRNVDLKLLKTSFYKDRNVLFEFYILAKSFLIYLYLLIFFKPHILHVHSSAYISFFRKSIFVLFGRLFRKKIVMHLHSSAFDEFFLSRNPIIRTYTRFVLRNVTRIIALCTDWQKKLENDLELTNVVMLPNPIELGEIAQNREYLQDNTLRVLFLGFLIKSKGIYDILELAKLIMQGGDSIQIDICGKGDLEDYILKTIKEEGLESVINFRGWVEADTKQTMLEKSDIFFLPSYNEGMPIAILEAMKFGLPIVSTHIAGIPDVVQSGHNGYLLCPGDIHGYHSVLRKLASDVELRQQMSIASYEKVKQFDAADIWLKLTNLYAELADQ